MRSPLSCSTWSVQVPRTESLCTICLQVTVHRLSLLHFNVCCHLSHMTANLSIMSHIDDARNGLGCHQLLSAVLRSAHSSLCCVQTVKCMRCNAGLLRITMSARSGQGSDASAAIDVAFDLLAALMQLPVAGVAVLRAAAAELSCTIRQHVQRGG